MFITFIWRRVEFILITYWMTNEKYVKYSIQKAALLFKANLKCVLVKYMFIEIYKKKKLFKVKLITLNSFV